PRPNVIHVSSRSNVAPSIGAGAGAGQASEMVSFSMPGLRSLVRGCEAFFGIAVVDKRGSPPVLTESACQTGQATTKKRRAFLPLPLRERGKGRGVCGSSLGE